VIPVFRTESYLVPLCERLEKALAGVRSEWIFVDDGSPDGSRAAIQGLQSRFPQIRLLAFARNFGQHAALSAGFEKARGEVVVTLDCDLQYAPEDIPRFLAKIREGHDFVSGWRTTRDDPLLSRRIPSRLFNALVRAVTGVPLHDYGCALNAMRRGVVEELAAYGEMRRFLKPLIAQVARRTAEVEIRNEARAGRSGYTLWRLCGLAMDFLISFSAKPFQWIGLGGLALFGMGAAGGIGYAFSRLAGVSANPPLTVILFLALVFGLLLATLGLVGEFSQRTYRLVQRRPFFVIEEER
jgi:glycosyltransferase involved in cell wall biosynthesis